MSRPSRRSSSRAPKPPTQWTWGSAVIFLLILAAWAFFTYGGDDGSTTGAPTAVPEQAQQQPTFRSGRPSTVPTTAGVAPASNWQLFFTTPRYPDLPAYHNGGLDERLVAFINTADTTVDIAIYDFDLENVAQALADAKARGVRVRMVTDTDTVTNDDEAIQATFAIVKKARIPVVEDDRGPIMHNKFVVVDNEAVLTGSWNFTDGDTYRLNNHAIILESAELATNYTTEFEKMFVARTFGPNKTPGVPHPRLTLNGAPAENYFAAEDDVADKILPHLQAAKRSIDFMAFSFTSDEIGAAVRERGAAGVTVRGVFETTGSQTQYSEFKPMQAAGLEVYTDGSPYVMHHKVFIIDGETVIFGSYNFSDNADTQNDENLLIIRDENLAQQFTAEFERMRNIARNPLKK